MVCTGADFAFSFCCQSQIAELPADELCVCIKRVFHYIRRTVFSAIIFERRYRYDTCQIGYCDSDGAGCKPVRKSTFRFVFLIIEEAISWNSTNLSTIVVFPAEEEYIALSHAALECNWICKMVKFSSCSETEPVIPICVDNQGAVKMNRNERFEKRSIHTDIKCHLTRNCTSEKKIICCSAKWPKRLLIVCLNHCRRKLSRRVQNRRAWNDTNYFSCTWVKGNAKNIFIKNTMPNPI